MTDHWLADHLEQERQAQALMDAQYNQTALQANLEDQRLQHARDEVDREQNRAQYCPNDNSPVSSPGLCASCIAQLNAAEKIDPPHNDIASFLPASEPSFSPIQDTTGTVRDGSEYRATLGLDAADGKHCNEESDEPNLAGDWSLGMAHNADSLTSLRFDGQQASALADHLDRHPETYDLQSRIDDLRAQFDRTATPTDPVDASMPRARIDAFSAHQKVSFLNGEAHVGQDSRIEELQRNERPASKGFLPDHFRHEFFCTNCQALSPTAGYCPTCGTLLKEIEIYGGAKGKLSGDGYEGHHAPSWYAIRSAEAHRDLTYGCAPAVLLEREDHYKTPTHNNQDGVESRGEAIMNRELQRLLIEDGQFDVAQDLDFMRIRELFGSKYDRGILDALIYSVDSGLRPDYGPWAALFGIEGR